MTDSLERTRREGAAPARDEQARGFLSWGSRPTGLWGLYSAVLAAARALDRLRGAGAPDLAGHCSRCWRCSSPCVVRRSWSRCGPRPPQAQPAAPGLGRDSLNWGGYIWGVTHGKVVETSLGYFINPLVTVLMGVLILGERLRPAAVGRDRDRLRGGRRPHGGVRAAAVDRAAAGVLVRHLRAGQEAGQRRSGGEPDLRDDRAGAVRVRLPGLARCHRSCALPR